MLSATEVTDRIMSARARKRLVNSALKNHPVAHEVLRCYKSLLDFKKCISDVLNKEELEEEAVMLDECEVVPLEEVGYFYLCQWYENYDAFSQRKCCWFEPRSIQPLQ